MPTEPILRLNEALEGRYAVERELGEGGMARVYTARDLRHDRAVALKVLNVREVRRRAQAPTVTQRSGSSAKRALHPPQQK